VTACPEFIEGPGAPSGAGQIVFQPTADAPTRPGEAHCAKTEGGNVFNVVLVLRSLNGEAGNVFTLGMKDLSDKLASH
jgi:hypothetical protein